MADISNSKCRTSPFICNWFLRFTGRAQTVYVRNCGSFYVYYLQPTPMLNAHVFGSYCAKRNFTGPSPSNSACFNYKNVSDPTRGWLTKTPYLRGQQACDDQQFPVGQWVRFSTNNFAIDMMIPNACPSSISNSSNFLDYPPCNALYRGWLSEGYPRSHEGRVERTLCFSSLRTCACEVSSQIHVMNCGRFYIYKRKEFPVCRARACTVEKEVLTTVKTRTTPPVTSNTSISFTIPVNQNISTTNQSNVFVSVHANTSQFEVSISVSQTPSIRSIENLLPNNALSSSLNYTLAPSTDITPCISTHKLVTIYSSISAIATHVSPSSSQIIMVPSTTVKPIEALVNMCQDYVTVIDDERFVYSSTPSQSSCDVVYRQAVRFVTSDNRNLQLKEGCDSTSVLPGRHCGSRAITWLMGVHPTVTDNPYPSTICIDTKTSTYPISGNFAPCTCSSKVVVVITNCGAFYVYKLHPMVASMGCIARYCLEHRVSNQSTSTTTTQTTKHSFRVPYSFRSALRIDNPVLNGEALTPARLADENIRIFLKDAIKKYIENTLHFLQDVRVTNLRYGSLIGEYISSTADPVNSSLIQETLFASAVISINNGQRQLRGEINTLSVSVQDIDECSLFPSVCHRNARCTNNPDVMSFTCSCDNGYAGDGFICEDIEERENEWSNDLIIIVSVCFSVAILFIFVLLACICIMKKTLRMGYEVGHFRGSKTAVKFDTYLTAPARQMNDIIGGEININMYAQNGNSLAKKEDRFRMDDVRDNSRTTF